MSELPTSWSSTTLNIVASWGSGGTPARKNMNYYNGTIPWIKTGELGGKFITRSEETITDLGLAHSSAKIFPAGSVVVAMYGATIGKTSILSIDAATNQACAVAVPIVELITKDYLYYFLCSQKDDFIKAGKGGAQPNISQSVLKLWPIPLPPIIEQKRIADKLDALLAWVDACREHLNRIPLIIKRFRQSVLAAATTGKLTEDWREELTSSSINSLMTNQDEISNDDIEFPQSWQTYNIDDVLTLIDGDRGPNYPKQNDYQEKGHCLFLSTKNVREFGFLFNDVVFISEKKHKILRNGTLERGDVVITTRGTLGNVAVYDDKVPYDVVRINSGMLILRKKIINVLGDFVKIYIASPYFYKQLNEKRTGSAQPQIPAGILKTFIIRLPTLAEQREIVRRVEALFAYSDRTEERYKIARDQVERLTPAILAKAFRGELVPQDPNDEPASVLLERIRNERELIYIEEVPKQREVFFKISKKSKAEVSMLKRNNIMPSHLSDILKDRGPLTAESLWSASQLDIDDFYDQLKDEEARGLLKEVNGKNPDLPRLLESAA
jgi:type I restriction enzyme S subunit